MMCFEVIRSDGDLSLTVDDAGGFINKKVKFSFRRSIGQSNDKRILFITHCVKDVVAQVERCYSDETTDERYINKFNRECGEALHCYFDVSEIKMICEILQKINDSLLQGGCVDIKQISDNLIDMVKITNTMSLLKGALKTLRSDEVFYFSDRFFTEFKKYSKVINEQKENNVALYVKPWLSLIEKECVGLLCDLLGDPDVDFVNKQLEKIKKLYISIKEESCFCAVNYLAAVCYFKLGNKKKAEIFFKRAIGEKKFKQNKNVYMHGDVIIYLLALYDLVPPANNHCNFLIIERIKALLFWEINAQKEEIMSIGCFSSDDVHNCTSLIFLSSSGMWPSFLLYGNPQQKFWHAYLLDKKYQNVLEYYQMLITPSLELVDFSLLMSAEQYYILKALATKKTPFKLLMAFLPDASSKIIEKDVIRALIKNTETLCVKGRKNMLESFFKNLFITSQFFCNYPKEIYFECNNTDWPFMISPNVWQCFFEQCNKLNIYPRLTGCFTTYTNKLTQEKYMNFSKVPGRLFKAVERGELVDTIIRYSSSNALPKNSV
jgi:hypothetical protein